MFKLLLVSLVLQVYVVSCEEVYTTPDSSYVTLDYSEYEVIFYTEEYNSASSIHSSYFSIVALLLFYLTHLLLH